MPLIKASIQAYKGCMSKLLPTPAKSHYTFNLRALSKVFAKGGAQREPVFYTFEEGLRFCVDAYE